ncbi:LuxR C-terminal-related transcriptional regulator [Streptomyces sp. NPDC051561]|uniref:LuxR C-terminal-related transcriptional regulator n=1 Tax=Streptomyces sp. NPDC051561 TaxID=3365658 RepID=UPI0037A80C30
MCRDSDIQPQSDVVTLCERGLDCYRRALAEGSYAGEVPDCVVELGLLRPQAGGDGRWGPVPAEIAAHEMTRPLERAILSQQQTVSAIHAALSCAEDVYRAEQRAAAAPVRLLHGSEVIFAALERASNGCKEELLTAQPGTRVPAILAKTLPRALALNRRGVHQRTLYQHSVRAQPAMVSYIEQISAAGAHIRTLNELFDRLIIYDRALAFIPDPRHELEFTALAIEHPAIISYFVKVFEHAWQRAAPMTPEEGRNRPPLLTDETRRAVLRLMVEGHTDTAIASRLGISTRTVSTHIRKAADLVGSRSRAQLAYQLARSAHLENGPDDSPEAS